MNLVEAVKKMLEDIGVIYFDKTEGWYEGDTDFRTGGEDIEFVLRNGKYYKEWDYVDGGIINRIAREAKEVTPEDIAEELSKENVTAEEIMTGAMINRGFWTNKTEDEEIDG